MAELYERVSGFLQSDEIVRAMTDEFGLDTIMATRTGIVLTVPTVLANLAEWLADPRSDSWYQVEIRTIDPGSLNSFLALTQAPDFERLGRLGLKVLLGNRHDDVLQRVAGRADISVAAAEGLLSTTAWAMAVHLAQTCGPYDSRQDAADLLAVEHGDLLDSGWGALLSSVSPVDEENRNAVRAQVATSQVSDGPGPESQPQFQQPAIAPRPERPYRQHAQARPRAVPDGEREWGDGRARGRSQVWMYLAGILSALLLVALLGGAFLLGRLSPDRSDADTAATAASVPEADTVGSEAAPPESSDDGQAEDQGLTVPQSDQAAGQVDADDWPGGRGPVPDTPPARRTLLVEQDGTLLLTGSAPNWEMARQVLKVAEENYPVDGVEITNQLTWHPDAATSIRSGDVVMPHAVSFDSGASDIIAGSAPSLDLAVSILLSTPTVYVVVTGHTDAQGDEAVNVSLASERVDATVNYLLAQGVIPGQVVTASAGEDDPTASNDTQEGRQSNRRVELLFKNFLATPPGSGS